MTENKNKSEELKQALGKHKGEKHLIIIQDSVDPDSISCALAHQLIASSFDIENHIIYNGVISHPENLALVNLLNIDLIKYNKEIDLSQYQGCTFVDGQGGTSSLTPKLKELGIKTYFLIDHHEKSNLLSPEFADIQKVGACATLYTEYLENGIIEINKDSNFEKVATALLHGIRSDTNNFLNAGERDYKAAGYISRYADLGLLSEILNIKKSRQAMDTIKKALEHKKIIDNYSISGVEYLRFDDRDSIPISADFLLNEENVHTSIVFGIIIKDDGKEYINGSFRTSNLTINADKFIKECFGKDPNNCYYGGAKIGSGGFEIPISFLSGCISGTTDSEFMKLKWKTYDQKITQCLLKHIGVIFNTNGNSE